MSDDEEIINELRAFYHIWPSTQNKLQEYERKIKMLEWNLMQFKEENKYNLTIMKQFIGKIKRIEQFLIENGLIRLLGKKAKIEDDEKNNL